jgi:hypothetical protein
MKVDHLRNINSRASKFGKIRKKKKKKKMLSKLFYWHFLILELWMYHTSLAWYEQEKLGHKAHLDAFPRSLWFLRLLSSKGGSQRKCTSVLQVGTRLHKSANSAPFEFA